MESEEESEEFSIEIRSAARITECNLAQHHAPRGSGNLRRLIHEWKQLGRDKESLTQRFWQRKYQDIRNLVSSSQIT